MHRRTLSACLTAALMLLLPTSAVFAGQTPEKGRAAALPAYPFPAVGVGAHFFRSDERVRVTETPDAWRFAPPVGAKPPAAAAGPVALVFCPGGGVEPTAYAPVMRQVAAAGGFPVYLLKSPPPGGASVEEQKRDGVARVKALVTGAARAAGTRWVVAGHSLGGAIAARFVRENPALAAGLVLVATTHPRGFDLSDFARPVTRVHGTLDGVASLDQAKRNARLLPPHTRLVTVEGGNHAQFAWYGTQPGDRPATIERRAQQHALVTALADTLRRSADGAAAARPK